MSVWIIFLTDISECLWNGVPQNKEDHSYMFDETTPVKDCRDLAYHVAHGGMLFFLPPSFSFLIFFYIILLIHAV